jgi:CheY-like chemotaxis protein
LEADVKVEGGRRALLFVDDTKLDVGRYRTAMARLQASYDSVFCDSVESALTAAATQKFDGAVIDLVMPSGPFDDQDTEHGQQTGYLLAAKLVDIFPDIKIFLLTNSSSATSLEKEYRDTLNIFGVFSKISSRPLDLIRRINAAFDSKSFNPQIFIVHGHDREMVEFVQGTVVDRLKWPKPIVLDEQAAGGLTIIEKFENFAQSADAVVVLMTPDDVGGAVKDMSVSQFRARQNVLFELGYFYGTLGRVSGKVFIVKRGNLEIPTDLSGVLYISVDKIDRSAADNLVRELSVLSI